MKAIRSPVARYGVSLPLVPRAWPVVPKL